MISKKMATALSKQATEEFYAAYLYRQIGLWCAENNYLGAAHWMKVQAEEELEHAEKFLTYLQDQDAHAEVGALVQPPAKYASFMAIFEAALAHEKKVTGWIRDLYDLATKENDVATQIFLQWFVTEQIEEEAQVRDIIAQLEMCKGSHSAALYIDHRLGKREGDDD